jgi:hypothetical protein
VKKTRLFALTPGYQANGKAPWDWVMDVRPWTAKRDKALVR